VRLESDHDHDRHTNGQRQGGACVASFFANANGNDDANGDADCDEWAD